MSIWLIESYDPERDMSSYEYDLDRGYFLSKEDADARIADIERGLEVSYQRYLDGVAERNTSREVARQERARRNEVLAANGFKPDIQIGDGSPYVERASSFASWRSRQETYEAVEVKQAETS